MLREMLDCQTCGACCCNTQRNIARGLRSYVEVLESDELFHTQPEFLEKHTELDILDIRQMKLVGDEQRCIALDGELGEGVRCKIYTLRPEGCRLVKPGDEECLRARASLRKLGLLKS